MCCGEAARTRARYEQLIRVSKRGTSPTVREGVGRSFAIYDSHTGCYTLPDNVTSIATTAARV
jgi:hypothetical protein